MQKLLPIVTATADQRNFWQFLKNRSNLTRHPEHVCDKVRAREQLRTDQKSRPARQPRTTVYKIKKKRAETTVFPEKHREIMSFWLQNQYPR